MSICAVFAIHVGYKKYAYAAEHVAARQQFFVEQQDLLVRLSKLLPRLVKQREVNAINQLLTTYESVLFALQLPVNMQVVIFDAPQQAIGLLAELAPDESYYMQIMQRPQQLAYSHAYTKSAMPDYPLFNYGLGILDDSGVVLGIVEAKIPEVALQEYLDQKLPTNFYAYIFAIAIGYMLLAGLIICSYVLFMRHKARYQAKIDRLQACLTMHDKYKDMPTVYVNVNIMQIINDIYAATNVMAHALGVTLIFPHLEQRAIYCYCDQKLLVQMLTAIVKNMLVQLGSNGSLQLEIHLSKNQITFEFTDNGFYCELDEGWQDIIEYIEHVHTAYVGNKITYSIERSVRNNVISLEQYQDC